MEQTERAIIQYDIMAIAPKLRDKMARRGARYDVVEHPHRQNSMESAELAHVPGDRKQLIRMQRDDLVARIDPAVHARFAKRM